MEFEYKYTQDGVNWDELSELYRRAPLGNKTAIQLETFFSNSMFKCFAWSDTGLIAAGRALADGADCSYICDVAVLPEYQGKSIGSHLISYLLKMSEGHNKVILYASPGREPVYKKMGFKPMKTALAIFKNQTQAIEMDLLSEERES